MIDPVSTQALVSVGTPLMGGGLLGFVSGYALKKIAKFLAVGLGLIALLLGYLEFQKWITVNWTVVQNQTSAIMNNAVHKAYVVTQHMNHGIPAGIGLGALGFLPGLALGFARG